MPFPPTDKSLEGTLRDTLERLTLVERRLAVGGSGSSVPYDAEPGMVMPFSGTTVPDGWLPCDGAAVSRAAYPELFTVVGTTYGAGDGSTTFNVPNYKGRVLVGQDTTQAEFDVLGETGGAKTHTLTGAQTPWAATSEEAPGYGLTATSAFQNRVAVTRVSAVVAHNNLQPYAVAQYIISTGQGVGGGGPSRSSSGGASTMQPGVITPYAGATVPTGWLLCDGAAVSRAGFPGLFAAIGTAYGAGDGSTTFNVPNLKGKVPVGADVTQTEFDVLGETGGAKTHTLTVAEMPAHRHVFQYRDNTVGTAAGTNAAQVQPTLDNNLASIPDTATRNPIKDTGGSGAHNNLQPYVVTNYIISTGAGSTPPSGAVVPVNLWQEFTLAKPGGLRPLNTGLIVWDGVVTGTLGATLDATKRLITVPSAGTYRVITHYGLAAAAGVGTSSAGYVDNVLQPGSQDYGNAGAAGVYLSTQEWLFTATAPAAVSIAAVAPLGMYDWTWMRIEKQEPFFPANALAITQGSSAQRDAIYGVPATDPAKASLANRVLAWFNTDKGYFETYYATTGTPGLTAKGLATGFPSGWYPAAGSNIWGTCNMMNDQAVAVGDVRVNLNTGELVGGMTVGNNVLIVPVGGIYEVSCHLYIWSPTGTWRTVQGFDVVSGVVHAAGTTSANWDIITVPRRSRIAAGVQLGVKTTGDAAQTLRGQNWPAIEVKYMGPPLVTG